MASMPMEARMARLEGAYEQITERLGIIEQRLGRVEEDISSLRKELYQGLGGMHQGLDGLRRDLTQRMDRQFFWVMTVLLVSLILPIILRFVGV